MDVHEYGEQLIMPFLVASGSTPGFLLAARESWIEKERAAALKGQRETDGALGCCFSLIQSEKVST